MENLSRDDDDFFFFFFAKSRDWHTFLFKQCCKILADNWTGKSVASCPSRLFPPPYIWKIKLQLLTLNRQRQIWAVIDFVLKNSLEQQFTSVSFSWYSMCWFFYFLGKSEAVLFCWQSPKSWFSFCFPDSWFDGHGSKTHGFKKKKKGEMNSAHPGEPPAITWSSC